VKVVILNNLNRDTALFILVSLLFVFSVFSITFSNDSIVKDIVYATGFLTAIIIVIYFKKEENNNEE